MNEVYEQTFLLGGSREGYYFVLPYKACTEFVFDEVVTVGDSHCYVSVESVEASCFDGFEAEVTDFGYADIPLYWLTEEELTCGYGTKYKPHIWKCGGNDEGWHPIEEMTNWYPGSHYSNISYPPGFYTCDSLVIPLVGIFPIRAVEDTASSSLKDANALKTSVNLCPNLAEEAITLTSKSNILEIGIYSVLNQLIETRKTNSKTVKIDLASYKSGTYFAKIKTEKGSVVKKFVRK